jgi:hypothetical protein
VLHLPSAGWIAERVPSALGKVMVQFRSDNFCDPASTK